MCMYVYVCVCISVYMCMYVHVSNVYLHVACRTCVKCACPSHCMYVYVCVCICMYLYVLVCICMYHIHMCMYCMYWHTCAYMCIHVYICKPHTGHIYSFMCWCPQQALNIPSGGGATSRPHSGQPWAAALPLYPAIRDPFPHPFWRTRARCTRRGGQSRPPAQPMGHPITMGTR